MIALLLSTFLLMADGPLNTSNISVLKTFQNPSEVSDGYLGYPYSMDFGPDGRLYVADRNQSAILIWDKNGKFLKSFGTKGDGPGELFFPVKISIVDGEIWVWDSHRKFSIYDLEGKYSRVIKFNHTPWNFTALSKNQALLGLRTIADDGTVGAEFRLLDEKGETKILKSWVNESFIRKVGADRNSATITAFAHELDIQRDGQGMIYFGFSQQKTLFKMDKTGKIVGEWKFQQPDVIPSEDDKSMIYGLSFPTPNGQRIGLKNFPGVTLTFDQPKAPFTQFLIKGNKVVFVQTPIGSLKDLGNGFSRASYFVNDLKTGKPIASGHYAYPEDSMVLYRNGRILACITAGEGDYELKEISLKGM